MAIYNVHGNAVDSASSGGVDVRQMLLSSEFRTQFNENYNSFAPSVSVSHCHGKKLIMIGDSLTAYTGGDGSINDGFLTHINKYLGMKMTNSGYAGSNWTGVNAGDCSTKVTNLVNSGVIYDVILLAWGTNSDSTKGLGTVNDTASSTGTMCAVQKWAIDSIRTAFPKSAVGIVIAPPSIGMSEEKANLTIENCKKMRVPYCDLFYGSNIYLSNTTAPSGLQADQTHLSTAGVRRYGAILGDFIQRICPYVSASE